jgi:hypothetical protein
MPRKVFVAGEILTAADVNTNLMDQAVMSFAGTAARGSAIPSPVEGMVTYLNDADRLEVYTNAWKPVGSILQVVSTVKTNTFTSTANTFSEVTSLTATITPSSANSKILVFASITGNRAPSVNEVGQFSVFRGTTNLVVPDSPENRTPSIVSGVAVTHTNSGLSLENYNFHIIDTPAVTTALTYSVRARANTSGQTVYVNRGITDADNSGNGRGVSTITVMEVAG